MSSVPADQTPSRYTLAGGRFGVESRVEYLRTALDIVLWLVLAPLPMRLLWRLGAARSARAMQRWWAHRVSRRLRLRFDWQGLDLIDRHASYVVTPLHEGLADALAMLQLPLPLRFVVRDEFADWPLLGGYLRDSAQIPIRPEDGRRAYRRILHAAREVFAKGESLVIFPQGTILGIEADFLPGAVGIARAFQRPLLPIAPTGTHRVWEYPYTPRLRRDVPISVRILPPIASDEIAAGDRDDMRQDLQRRLKRAALSPAMTPPRHFVPARDGFWDGYAYTIDPTFPDLAATLAAHRAHKVDSRGARENL